MDVGYQGGEEGGEAARVGSRKIRRTHMNETHDVRPCGVIANVMSCGEERRARSCKADHYIQDEGRCKAIFSVGSRPEAELGGQAIVNGDIDGWMGMSGWVR